MIKLLMSVPVGATPHVFRVDRLGKLKVDDQLDTVRQKVTLTYDGGQIEDFIVSDRQAYYDFVDASKVKLYDTNPGQHYLSGILAKNQAPAGAADNNGSTDIVTMYLLPLSDGSWVDRYGNYLARRIYNFDTDDTCSSITLKFADGYGPTHTQFIPLPITDRAVYRQSKAEQKHLAYRLDMARFKSFHLANTAIGKYYLGGWVAFDGHKDVPIDQTIREFRRIIPPLNS